ncbi:hypothetical protein [Lucifera butyrica]|nr:hypothetical protein [Lucifera butyrica]
MELVQLAGLYFLGTEEFNSSNCMMSTVVLKEKIDMAKLALSYRQLILENPLLQTKIIECPAKNRFTWGRFSAGEVEWLLCFEERQLSQRYDQEAILKQYYPTNARLPFYISVVAENTVIICMNHILANGRCFIYWIQKWLQYYAGDQPGDRNGGQLTDATWRDKSLHWLKRTGAFLWLPVFLAAFLLKGGRKAVQDTVDLSRGKQPAESNEYAVKSYGFSREETAAIRSRCKAKGMTLTEYMCGKLAQGFLQHDPDKQRVLVSMPMDMHALMPYSPEDTYGNLIVSLPAQFFRAGEMEKQVKSVFKWFKRGIPYSLSCLFAAISPSYEKVKLRCLKLCQKPVPARSPLGNFTLTYSSLGVISYPVLEKMVDAIYFYFKPQAILVASSILGGRLYMQVSLTRDLYNAGEVFALFDRLLAMENLVD